MLKKLLHVKKAISDILKSGKPANSVLFFQPDDVTKYKITIEKVEVDEFIDSNGTKWVREVKNAL